MLTTDECAFGPVLVLFTLARSRSPIDWDAVFFFIATMHDSNFMNTVILQLELDLLKSGERGRSAEAKTAHQLALRLQELQQLQEHGNLSTSFTKLREIVST